MKHIPRRTLFDAIIQCGYQPIVRRFPGRTKNVLGSPKHNADAAVLDGRRIAVKSNSWEYAYAVSHEIAEHIWGFKHSPEMFCQQANILAIWIEDLSVDACYPEGTRSGPYVRHGI